jgi:hypothetical protein
MAFFASRGEAFTPSEAPSGIADWRDEVVRFQPGSSVESAVYGIIRCVDPSKACTFAGVPEADRTRPVWIVGFDQTPADSECPRWVVVELVTAEDDLGSHVEQPWCASWSGFRLAWNIRRG